MAPTATTPKPIRIQRFHFFPVSSRGTSIMIRRSGRFDASPCGFSRSSAGMLIPRSVYGSLAALGS